MSKKPIAVTNSLPAGIRSEEVTGGGWQLNSLAPLAAAIVGALHPGASVQAQATPESDEDELGIETVLVTATKRSTNLQEVPQSITAFSTGDIQKMDFKSMEDYMKAIPSASLVNSMPGRNSLSMRGISTGSAEYRTDSQVAVYLDEQPITSISQQPEVRMVDIARLESLPGPQGTLFGSSSQSGTLRIITNQPDFAGFSGEGTAELATTNHGKPSYEGSGVLNIPVVDDTLAIRLVGFYSHDGGYVDNVLGETVSGKPGAYGSPLTNADVVKNNQNTYDEWGGRAVALWQISEDWTANLSYIMQDSKADGTWESDPYLGDYKVTRFHPEYRDDKWWQTSLNFNGDLGFAEFVSTTSYFDRTSSYEWDNQVYNQWQTSYYGVYNGFLPYDFEYEFGHIFNYQTQERFAQELRLTSQSESKLQWMVGAFYDEVQDQWSYGAKIDALTQTTAWDAINNGWDVEYTYNGYTYTYHYNGACDYAAQGYDVACPLPDTNITYLNDYDRKIKQLAFFGELTYNLTDNWTVTGGMRWFQFDRKDLQIYQVPKGQPPLGSFGRGEGVYASEGKDSDMVWKFSTQYNFTDDTMVYFLFSEGFRLGGNNSPRAAATGTIPATYDPDLLKNYELGAKTQWLDNRLLINVSLFDMQWSDIQINSRVGDGPWWLRGTWNGETGESIGAEMNFEWQATQNLSFQGSAYFADSKYTADSYDPRGNLYLQDGEDMPNAPKVKYWLAAEYTVPGIAGLEWRSVVPLRHHLPGEDLGQHRCGDRG